MNIDKKNIDRILRGQEVVKKTQVGYRNIERQRESSKSRNVGDTWIEKDPVTGIEYQWEQLKGYKRKTVKGMANLLDSAKIAKFKNCPHSTCKCVNPTRLDNKLDKLEGQCSDCHFKHLTEMQLSGEFPKVVQEKIEANYAAWRVEAFADYNQIIDEVSRNLTYHNTDGSSEVWNSNSVEIKNRITKEFTELIARLDAKYNYKGVDNEEG